MRFDVLMLIAATLVARTAAQETPRESESRLIPIAEAWAQTSVNAVVFRRNSLVSSSTSQYAAFYDADSNLVLAKRALGDATWQVRTTQYKGNVRDAHNSISIMVDGEEFLHVSWNHHGHPLNYCRSKSPGSLELADKIAMTGRKEKVVTYPEFYSMPSGDLLFLYRDGGSGHGDLMVNHYDVVTKTWTQRQDALLDGEGERNAYWQMCVDDVGGIHLSWVWRESGDVATNHDMAYAKSTDGGVSWQRSSGETYELPITMRSAEYAARIPEGSDLINTTSMCTDRSGRPYIATYWTPKGSDVPQYHLIFQSDGGWTTQQVGERTSPFSLSGGGTKRIPISRCQILVDATGPKDRAYLVFRDQERESRVSVAICDDLGSAAWRIEDLTQASVGMWEPSYDTELWRRAHKLDLYVQRVGQGDGEQLEDVIPQMVSVLEWRPRSIPQRENVKR